jgi:hypothetical protein
MNLILLTERVRRHNHETNVSQKPLNVLEVLLWLLALVYPKTCH